MTEYLDIFGINLPFFIVINLFFAYLIWSKFLNNSKLKIEDVDDIIEILSISGFLIVFLLSIILITNLIIDILNLRVNLNEIWNKSQNLVAILAIIGIMMFMGIFINKTISRHKVKKFLSYGIRGLSLYMTILLMMYLFGMYASSRFLIKDIFLLFLLIFLSFGLCLVFASNISPSINWDVLLNKNFLIYSIFVIIFLFAGFIISQPKYNEGKILNEGYFVHLVDYNKEQIFRKVRIPINIESFGFEPISPVIPIRYDKYNLDLTDLGKKEFKIYVNSTKHKEKLTLINSFDAIQNFKDTNINKFGFTDTIIDSEREQILLKFDKNDIDENITTLYVEGYINVSTNLFNYHDTTQNFDVCNENGCRIYINVTNELDAPIIYVGDRTLLNYENRQIKNISSCKLMNFSSNFPIKGEVFMQEPACDDNLCSLWIYDRKRREDILNLQIRNEPDINVIRLLVLRITSTIKLNSVFEMRC